MYLQVMMTCIRAWTISNFSLLGPLAAELAALERLKKSTYAYNGNQRTNGPVNAHLISWLSKAQNIQNLEKCMVKK